MATEIRSPEFHRLANALEGIEGVLKRLTSPDEVVRAMREHAAENDHVIELRLIDYDVFGVRCATCPTFHHEWRTK